MEEWRNFLIRSLILIGLEVFKGNEFFKSLFIICDDDDDEEGRIC